ncbi:hypothetical protein ACIRL2_45180 [Embleya sp. NPDC127516]|uniref:hypothetical protein n=1 Tax=Embleya sp. NPDC127516 TaxID=3363990 RepID=UPI003805D888
MTDVLSGTTVLMEKWPVLGRHEFDQVCRERLLEGSPPNTLHTMQRAVADLGLCDPPRLHSAGPRRLPDGLQPQCEIAGLDPAGPVPGNVDRAQEAEPRKKFVGVRPQRGWLLVIGQHVVEGLAYGLDLAAVLVQQRVRAKRFSHGHHPSQPGDPKRRYVPNPRTRLRHLCPPHAAVACRHAISTDADEHPR